MLNDNVTPFDYMVEQVVSKLNHKLNDLGMTNDQAIKAVKKESCAGPRVWVKAMDEVFNNKEVN